MLNKKYSINFLHWIKIIHIHALELDIGPLVLLFFAVCNSNHLFRKIDSDNFNFRGDFFLKDGYDGGWATAQFDNCGTCGYIKAIVYLTVKAAGLPQTHESDNSY